MTDAAAACDDEGPVLLCGATDRAAWRVYAAAALVAELARCEDRDVARRLAAKHADALFGEELNRCTEEEMNRSAKGG